MISFLVQTREMMNNTCPVNLTVTTRFFAFTMVYSAVLLVGLPLNGLSLWILLKKHGLRTSNTVFMVNLALSDLLLALSLPLRIYYYATATWPFEAVACTLATMLFRFNIFSSSIFITFISVDRLLAVVFPVRSRQLRTAKHATIAGVVAWLLLSALGFPMAIKYYQRVGDVCKGENCFELHTENSKESPNPGVFVFPIFITFILLPVNVFSTGMVLKTLQQWRKELRKYNKTNIILIFIGNCLMFVVFFLPGSIMMCLSYLNVDNVDRDVVHSTFCFTTLNCCLDPFIYYFSLDAFWKKEMELDTEE